MGNGGKGNMGGAKKYITNISLALLVLVLIFLFLNYFFGLLVDENKWSVNCGFFREYDNGVYDPYALYRPTPNLHGLECYTNDQGFRNKNNISKIADRKRVFIFGGSTVWGIGVAFQNQTISYQMEALLNKNSKQKWEVFNAAVSGYNIHQEFIQLYTKVMKLEPDYIIFIDGLNDMQYGSFDWWSQEVDHKKYNVLKDMMGKKTVTGVMREAFLSLLNYPFNYDEGSNLLLYLEMKRKESQVAGDMFKGHFNLANEASARNYVYYLSLIDDIARSRNITAVFILQPILGFNENRTYSNSEKSLMKRLVQIGNWLEAANSTYSLFQHEFGKFSKTAKYAYDFTGVFDNEEKRMYIDAAHYTPYANFIISREIVERILEIEERTPEIEGES